MIRIFYHTESQVEKAESLDMLERIPSGRLIWIDLQFATEEEKRRVEARFGINFQEQQELSTIESNSRFYEAEGFIYVNSSFIAREGEFYVSHSVVFFLIDEVLITQRDADLPSFAETVKKLKRNRQMFGNGADVLEVILETKVDIDGDLMEAVARQISVVSKSLSLNTTNEEELLIGINTHQENAMLIRESLVDKQRVISALLKSNNFKNDQRLKIVIKDINSMLEFSSFIFTRLEYLQNTLLGMINMQQNKTIKIFTIVSVIFMPPTLIASIYGMNFKTMPELDWTYGYWFAIMLIVLSSLITLFIFKIKKWL